MFSPFRQKPEYQALRIELRNRRTFRSKNRQLLRQGCYNLTTVWRHRLLYLHTGQLRDYVDYLSCRRAFGYPVTPRQHNKLMRYTLLPFPFRWLQAMYGIRAFRYQHLANLSDGSPDWRRRQQLNMQELSNTFIQRVQRAKSIIVVGNSASLNSSNSGSFIDSHEVVFRCNHCFAQPIAEQTTGKKISYWVIAPDCQTPLRLTPEQCCVLSGPEILGWIKSTKALQHLTGQNSTVQIPLAIWRELVIQLGAPPSSGLLILHWLFTLVTDKSVIQRIGFSAPEQFDQEHYHSILPAHKGSARHHWNMEWKLQETWFQSQLRLE